MAIWVYRCFIPCPFLINSILNIHGTIDKNHKSYTVNVLWLRYQDKTGHDARFERGMNKYSLLPRISKQKHMWGSVPSVFNNLFSI